MRGGGGFGQHAAKRRPIRRRRAAGDEVQRGVDHVARRRFVVDHLEGMMAARIVDDGDRHVLGLRQRDQVGHRAVDGRAIEAGPHEQRRQVTAERLHVGGAVVQGHRLERRPPRIDEQRQGARHVAGGGVDGDPVGIRPERGAVGRQVREQRIEVLLHGGEAQIRQDRHQALRSGDLRPGLVERLAQVCPGPVWRIWPAPAPAVAAWPRSIDANRRSPSRALDGEDREHGGAGARWSEGPSLGAAPAPNASRLKHYAAGVDDAFTPDVDAEVARRLQNRA